MSLHSPPVPRGPEGLLGAANLTFRDLEPQPDDFEAEVVRGLGLEPKSLPCKYFYDQPGSALFERICELEEYYPTRTETALLERHAAEIAARIGAGCHLIELGSGSSRKVRLLLDALGAPAAYTAVDISRDHLLESAAAVARDFPDIDVIAVCADYTGRFEIPRPPARRRARPVGFFPGSTIGNFTPGEAVEFLAGAAALLRGGGMVIGVDLKKDAAVLNAAYNDREGVTAAFNLNILARINRELGGDFDLAAFAHQAFYDNAAGRIEMHLVSRRDQAASVAGVRFAFAEGETIHTENSYKYTVEEFQTMARRAGFAPLACWTDDDGLFSIHYLGAE